MKASYKRALLEALSTASEMIRGHMDCGYLPSEDGVSMYSDDEYGQAINRAAKMIDRLSKRVEKFKTIEESPKGE